MMDPSNPNERIKINDRSRGNHDLFQNHSSDLVRREPKFVGSYFSRFLQTANVLKFAFDKS